LQSCSVKNNSLRLKTLLNATTSKSLKNGLGALLTILLLDFKVAEELYADLHGYGTNTSYLSSV
jgi:hypothetical protein